MAAFVVEVPLDIAVEDLQIEAYVPLDETTELLMRGLVKHRQTI